MTSNTSSSSSSSSGSIAALTCALVATLAYHSSVNQDKLAQSGVVKALHAVIAANSTSSATLHHSHRDRLTSTASLFDLRSLLRSAAPHPPAAPPPAAPSSPLPAPAAADPPAANIISLTTIAPADCTVHAFTSSALKEACRAVYFLCLDHALNRAKFLATSSTADGTSNNNSNNGGGGGVLDLITAALAASSSSSSSAGRPGGGKEAKDDDNDDEKEELQFWMKKAVDILIGSESAAT